MTIGRRRHRVVFQRATISTNDFGEPEKSWATLATSWAEVRPLKGTERFAAEQIQADVDHKIFTRYRSELADLTPADRATWDGKTFDIRAVVRTDHRNRLLEILAQEHVQ